MDLVAGPIYVGFMALLLIFSLVSGLVSAIAHRKTNNVMVATLAGGLPLFLMCIVGTLLTYRPSPPPHAAIGGGTYTGAMPPPSIPAAQSVLVEDPKNLDLLQSFGIDRSMIDVCRRQGCRVDFTAAGGYSSVGPVKVGGSYALNPATKKWKRKQ